MRRTKAHNIHTSWCVQFWISPKTCSTLNSCYWIRNILLNKVLYYLMEFIIRMKMYIKHGLDVISRTFRIKITIFIVVFTLVVIMLWYTPGYVASTHLCMRFYLWSLHPEPLVLRVCIHVCIYVCFGTRLFFSCILTLYRDDDALKRAIISIILRFLDILSLLCSCVRIWCFEVEIVCLYVLVNIYWLQRKFYI